MEGTLWKTSVLIVAALFIGSCQAFEDWHGYEYEQTLELADMKDIIAGKRPDKLRAPEESEVAGYLAKVKDKKSPLFNGTSSLDLLALSLDDKFYSGKSFCSAKAFKKFEATCVKVQENQFLGDYCNKNLLRLRTICTINIDWLYKRLVIEPINYDGHSKTLYEMADDLITYAMANQLISLPPGEIVNEESLLFDKDEKDACAIYLEKLDDLFVIDKKGKKLYAYMKKQRRYQDLHMKEFCDALKERRSELV